MKTEKNLKYSDLLEEFRSWYGFPTGPVGLERLLLALMSAGSPAQAKAVVADFIDRPILAENGRPRCPLPADVLNRIEDMQSKARTAAMKSCDRCHGDRWYPVEVPCPRDLAWTGIKTYRAMRRCECMAALVNA